MKKFILFIFLVIQMNICFSQVDVYHPLPSSYAGWSEKDWGYQNGDCRDYHYWIIGDTLYDGYLYHKVQVKGTQYFMGDYGCTNIVTAYFNSYAGAYRNDSVNKKVYFLPVGHTHDTILYDFNLQQGQELPRSYLYYPNGTAYVTFIDSALVGTQYNRSFDITNGNGYNYADLIEGVGSTTGLLQRIIPPLEAYTYLLCFEHNGVAAYPSGSGDCGIYTGVKANSEDLLDFQIYPNPVLDKAKIMINSSLEITSVAL